MLIKVYIVRLYLWYVNRQRLNSFLYYRWFGSEWMASSMPMTNLISIFAGSTIVITWIHFRLTLRSFFLSIILYWWRSSWMIQTRHWCIILMLWLINIPFWVDFQIFFPGARLLSCWLTFCCFDTFMKLTIYSLF
jgi:hypothetical protein